MLMLPGAGFGQLLLGKSGPRGMLLFTRTILKDPTSQLMLLEALFRIMIEERLMLVSRSLTYLVFKSRLCGAVLGVGGSSSILTVLSGVSPSRRVVVA